MARVLTLASMAASSGANKSVGEGHVAQYNGACWRVRRKTSDLVSTVISVLLRFIMLPPVAMLSPVSAGPRRNECDFAAKAGKMSFHER
jgi:hypothetical protein